MNKKKFFGEELILRKNNYNFSRTQRLYEKEISVQLHKLIIENKINSCSVSYVILSKKRESLEIYLDFLKNDKEKTKDIELLNEKISKVIRNRIMKNKNFAKIPKLIFLTKKEEEKEFIKTLF